MAFSVYPPPLGLKRAERVHCGFRPGGFAAEAGQDRTDGAVGDAVIASGKPQIVKSGGMEFELRATGWTDANGVWGYLRMPGPAVIQTARLGTRELAAKDERDPIPDTPTHKK